MKTSLFFVISIFSFVTIYSQKNSYIKEKQLILSNYRRSSYDDALMKCYDVKFYFLDISLENTSTKVEGKVTCKAQVKSQQLDTFAFELLSTLTVDSIILNGTTCSFIRNGDVTYGLFNSPINEGDLFEATVYYRGIPPSSGFFSGISSQQSPTWKCRVTWTLSEPFNAYQWWPCKQDLKDKIDSVWVFITTSYPNMAGSNGILTNVTDLGNGKRRFEWKSNYPIAYYLISAAVAKYTDYSFKVKIPGLSDSILVQNYVYDTTLFVPQLGGTYNCLEYFRNDINKTSDFLILYSQLFGNYPFYKEKYGHCMAPLGGGMEHQTMTTLGNFNFYLVCHELSHQWFGNNVTCAQWNDIFVNEGFADYSEYIAAENLLSLNEANNLMLEKHNRVMSEPGGSIYIYPTEPLTESRIFDGRLSYNKGGAFIHMLRYEVNNDSLFFAALKEYQRRFADSVAVGLDFKTVLEEVTGIDFTDMFNQWYFGEGYPTYSCFWSCNNDTINLNINHTSSTNTTTLFKGHLDIKLNSSVGDTLVRLYILSNNELFKIYMPRPITGIVIDPYNKIVNKIGTISTNISHAAYQKVLFNIYPNPALDEINISISEISDDNYLVIKDIVGRIILEQKVPNRYLKIDVSSFAEGVYYIYLINKTNILGIGKFIKTE